MASKNCVYRDCNNKSSVFGNITYFGFPLKDATKCKLWSERSGFTLQPQRNHFLCELHFSPIYISKTPRRTVLLPTAVPYHHTEEVESTTDILRMNSAANSADENFNTDDIFDDDEPNYLEQDEEDAHKSSATEDIAGVMYEEEVSKPQPKASNVPIGVKIRPVKLLTKAARHVPSPPSASPVIGTVESLAAQYGAYRGDAKKRKPSDNDAVLFKHQTMSTDEHFIVDNISSTPEISCLTYRGEECVQMPKRKFLDQRAELISEINKYKDIVNKMRQLLHDELA